MNIFKDALEIPTVCFIWQFLHLEQCGGLDTEIEFTEKRETSLLILQRCIGFSGIYLKNGM